MYFCSIHRELQVVRLQYLTRHGMDLGRWEQRADDLR